MRALSLRPSPAGSVVPVQSGSRVEAQRCLATDGIVRLVSASLVLLGAFVALVITLAWSFDIGVQWRGLETSVVVALMWLGSVELGRRCIIGERVADFIAIFGLLWFVALGGGFLALLGLRFEAPLADTAFHAIDRALGFDHLPLLGWVSARPGVIDYVRTCYGWTVMIMTGSILLAALRGQRRDAWLASFGFTATLLATCLIAMLVPAKGLGVWTPPAALSAMPEGSMTFFWASFDQFHSGAARVLDARRIDGVISFPSFHIAMGIIALFIWRRSPLVLLGLTTAWFVPMLVAAITLGGHYLIDLVAGSAIVAACLFAGARLLAEDPQRVFHLPEARR